ncbi:hypothetical protein BOTBODRAFT_585669 [Botryobasidium botryosum FD-172 SS1]|uniref:Uncharacterized protein n=1 Tax=Botryobasidium botryosum (strain FD-172 SS1) TaxID=930990 RepID=A0A067LXB1_BOTB1|nr:hypothetical protein BOTBODRAFT_585669 [Botryobasidium botryosum FD-172 SS1]
MLKSLRSRESPPLQSATPHHTQTTIPSIRVVSATPDHYGSIQSPPLLPVPNRPSRRTLVPKKSLAPLDTSLAQASSASPVSPSPAITLSAKADTKASVRSKVFGTGRSSLKVSIEPVPEDEGSALGSLFVKKKKSRAGLGSLGWSLGDRSAHASAEKEREKGAASGKKEKETMNSIRGGRVTPDEEVKEKWKWTIGKGRSKDKEKAKKKSSSPFPTISNPTLIVPQEIGLVPMAEVKPDRSSNGQPNRPAVNPPKSTTPANGSASSTPIYRPPPITTSMHAFQLVPLPPSPIEEEDPEQLRTGSLALRAMRSVRSIARIGSWAQLRSDKPAAALDPPKEDKKSSVRMKDKKGKRKSLGISSAMFDFDGAERAGNIREAGSGESWLIGAPSYDGSPILKTPAIEEKLGGRSGETRRLSRESASTGSSYAGSAGRPSSDFNHRRSESSATSLDASTIGTFASQRSTTITNETKYTFSNGRQTVRKTGTTERPSGRKRPSLANLFDMARAHATSATTSTAPARPVSTSAFSTDSEPLSVASSKFPELTPSQRDDTIKRNSAPGLRGPVNLETPVKARPRPMSEQMLRPRPQGVICDQGSDVAISIVSAATTELCDLINRLDLQATPEAPSPGSRRWLHGDSPEVPALPHRQADMFASVGSSQFTKLPLSTSITAPLTSLPPVPPAAPKPEVSFNPPPRSHKIREPSITSLRPYAIAANRRPTYRPHSSASSLTGSDPSFVSAESPLKGLTMRAAKHKAALAAAAQKRKEIEEAANKLSMASANGHDSVGSRSLAPGARRGLGMSGTMGAEDTCDMEPLSDDQDSDIPDELQVILSTQSETTSMHSMDTFTHDGSPRGLRTNLPRLPLARADRSASTLRPKFRMAPPRLDDPTDDADVDESSDEDEDQRRSCEDDTGKRSFDFTGELNQLNKAGVRTSFVEQLENAFKTPLRVAEAITPLSFVGLPQKLPSLPKKLASAKWEESLDAGNEDIAITMKPSYGQINRAFKFGGVPPATSSVNIVPNPPAQEVSPMSNLGATMVELAKLNRSLAQASTSDVDSKSAMSAKELPEQERPLSPPSSISAHTRESSLSSEFDESVFAIANADLSLLHPSAPDAHPLNSTQAAPSIPSAPPSVCGSFQPGVESGRHVRIADVNGGPSNPLGFQDSSYGSAARGSAPPSIPLPPVPTTAGQRRPESYVSVASMSSVGRVINPGMSDPFGYALDDSVVEYSRAPDSHTGNGIRPGDMSLTLLAERRRRNRMSVESDKSSFYFTSIAPPGRRRSHRRNDSVMSGSSFVPPISFRNSYYARGHRRTPSGESGNSLNGARPAWLMHRPGQSTDSIMSSFSGHQLGRPGLGDKMLESAIEYGMPLSAIQASPAGSDADPSAGPRLRRSASLDSIMDHRDSLGSIFGPGRCASAESDSLFESEEPPKHLQSLFPPTTNRRRPDSMLSTFSMGSIGEEDTMISMLGGGYARPQSIGSVFDASPCYRRKRYPGALWKRDAPSITTEADVHMSPAGDAMICPNIPAFLEEEKPVEANHDATPRQILEQHHIEEISPPKVPTPTLIMPISTSARNSICDETFGGHDIRSRPTSLVFQPALPDTPPLSAASSSDGSQSSIDMARLTALLENASAQSSNNARLRARGQGHRRRVSQTSRKSIIETITEENSMRPDSLPPTPSQANEIDNLRLPSFSWEKTQDSAPRLSFSGWDSSGDGTDALQKFLAFQHEALNVMEQSKSLWHDTEFSRFAISAFDPPANPVAIKALIEHSQQTYKPLPTELCIRRRHSRALSRSRPYEQPVVKINIAPSHKRTPSMEQAFDCISPYDQHQLYGPPSTALAQALSPLKASDNIFRSPGPRELTNNLSRPGVFSSARRNASGWPKRNAENDTAKPLPLSYHASSRAKENRENEATGLLPKNTSLKITRPRPRGRIAPNTSLLSSMRA